MKINKETALEEIRTHFASQFDGLKLEFFKKYHADSSGSSKKSMLDSSLLVSEVNPSISEGDMAWDKSMTVSKIEQLLESRFGLHAQVFRLTGLVWIETTTTDSYTLEKQMSKYVESQTSI